MALNEYEIKKQICDIGKRIYNRNMVAANDGNISVKISDNEFLCTPTGVSKGFMTPEYICKVDAQGNVIQANGNFKPSSEIKMHMRVYQERPDVRSVVHAHPVYATSFAIAGYKLSTQAALVLKEQTGAELIVVSMGPPPAEGMLREVMARGVDRAVLVSAREFGGSDTYATSQILAAAIDKIGVDKGDIVMCGRQAIDGDTAQVGPQIAEKLGLPQVTYVTAIDYKDGELTVRRELEDGYMTIKVQTPCVLTCIKELNTPRYMSVGGVFECYSKPYEIFDYNTLKDHPFIDKDTIGLSGSPTNILTSFTPPQKGAGMMLEGADKATCEKLAGIMAAKHMI